MPWYGYIHPLLALITLAHGIRTARVGMNKVLDWDYPLRRQRNRSIVFLLLCVGNLVLGFSVNVLLRGQDAAVHLTMHLPLAVAVTVLAVVAVICTFIRPKRLGELSGPMRIHHWLLIVASVMVLTMALTGLLRVLGI
ncbi:MAG TPA: hypothetical protein ENN51_04985 [candidate division WOR-3 bacterium]|uniref:DUF4079 family protein n=1 Tax=candidate division WOR-3 bacterium TaxID=2052148 RepID=A0A7V0XF23_UNCW3|nr:hypothetical protein [candidate division WOR-3 bacterium]